MPMKIIILLFTLLLAACGAEAPTPAQDPPPAPAIADSKVAAPLATITEYSVKNGTVGLPTAADQFCLSTYYRSHGGNSFAPRWPNGVPKRGAQFSARPTVGYATPYWIGTTPDPRRYASIRINCMDYDHFGFGQAAGQSQNWEGLYIFWNDNGTGDWRWHDIALWHWAGGASGSFCFLDGVDGLSHADEVLSIYPNTDGRWHLYAHGYPRLRGDARCIAPDRNFELEGPFFSQNNTTVWATPEYNSVCGFTLIRGSIDDAGIASIEPQSGVWTLKASGVSAEMWCAKFVP
jgi:hypothetical protein